MVSEIDRLGALQVGVAGHRPVEMLLGAYQEHVQQLIDALPPGAGGLTYEQHDVCRDLIVARARSVELAADRPDELGQPSLDRAVDVLVLRRKAKALGSELVGDRVESAQQFVALRGADDLAAGEHHGVRPRLRDVVRPEAAIEAERGVERPKIGILRL